MRLYKPAYITGRLATAAEPSTASVLLLPFCRSLELVVEVAMPSTGSSSQMFR
jgi:hypothetical protein